MIVWSRGLGKQRLPIELKDSTLRRESEHLAMEGIIEPVFWNYSIKLGPQDLLAFLKLLTHPKTIGFLAEREGILIPFVVKLIAVLPRLVFNVLVEKTIGKFRRKEAK